MDRIIKQRKEYKVKLEKDQLDYLELLNTDELKGDIICPKCQSEKELVMTPYWGFGRTYYTCYFVCPQCDGRR